MVVDFLKPPKTSRKRKGSDRLEPARVEVPMATDRVTFPQVYVVNLAEEACLI